LEEVAEVVVVVAEAEVVAEEEVAEEVEVAGEAQAKVLMAQPTQDREQKYPHYRTLDMQDTFPFSCAKEGIRLPLQSQLHIYISYPFE
jgi:hypothetical protein